MIIVFIYEIKMSSHKSPVFKLSLISLAILSHQSYAETSQQLPTITIAVDRQQANKSSEQSKAYIRVC